MSLNTSLTDALIMKSRQVEENRIINSLAETRKKKDLVMISLIEMECVMRCNSSFSIEVIEWRHTIGICRHKNDGC